MLLMKEGRPSDISHSSPAGGRIDQDVCGRDWASGLDSCGQWCGDWTDRPPLLAKPMTNAPKLSRVYQHSRPSLVVKADHRLEARRGRRDHLCIPPRPPKCSLTKARCPRVLQLQPSPADL
jgi:hypothetical protein